MVFLVFMALKVKPKTLAEFSKPFDYIRAKKLLKIIFFYLVFDVAFKKIFLAFFIFSEIFYVYEVYWDAVILYLSSISFQRVSGSNFPFPIIVIAPANPDINFV